MCSAAAAAPLRSGAAQASFYKGKPDRLTVCLNGGDSGVPFASVNGLTIHYRFEPIEGRPVVAFANSLGTDYRLWGAVARVLRPRFSMLFYDKRGHGLSEPAGETSSIADQGGDLIGLLDTLGLGRCGLVGLSIGGMIAQEVAARAPGRVASLVLCDTAARIGTAEMWQGRIRTALEHGVEALADGVLERWLTPAYLAAEPAAMRGWRRMLTGTSPQGYAAACAALRDADLAASTATIRTPTLAVGGAEDVATPPEVVAATARLIPGARFAPIGSCGHIPPIEQPERLARMLLDHFTETLDG